MKEPLKHASFFSGIGGPDLAAEWMGWENILHCEWNPFGRRILKYHFPKSKSYEDITKTDFSIHRGTINVLTGGFPCQPFSHAGSRKGADDNRYLWPAMLRGIDQIRPDWVVAENVTGLTSMVFDQNVVEVERQVYLEGEEIYRTLEAESVIMRICEDLERIGYDVQPVIIPACAKGAPHRRDRIFIIANAIDHGNKREPGKHEGESGKERVSERDQVQRTKKPAVTRSDLEGVTTNTTSSGGRQNNGIGEPKQFNKSFSGKTKKVTTDANPKRLQGIKQYRSFKKKREVKRKSGQLSGSIPPTWENFPTQPPICGGNDGLPSELDGITVPSKKGFKTLNKKQSFSKWRNESIKAYGNAIVPQIMYEIFKAIQIEENKTL